MADDLDEVLASLSTHPFASTLSGQGRLWLARQGAPLSVALGESFASEGEPADAAFLVLNGRVERRRGKRVLFTQMPAAGLAIDELALLEGGTRPCSLVSASPCRLWRIPREAVVGALEREPKAASQLVATLSSGLRSLSEALEVNAKLSLGHRLALMILHEQNARGLVALTQKDLAIRVKASRERVNRKLNEWARSGWVELTRVGVRLLEPEQIRLLTRSAT